MIETKILCISSIIQIILYLLIGLVKKDFAISYMIYFLSLVIYLALGIGLTLWNYNNVIAECGSRVFNPLLFISIIGNFLNIGILGFSYLVLKALKRISKSNS